MFNIFEELSIPILENGLRLPEIQLSNVDAAKYDIESNDSFEYLQNITAHGLVKLIREGYISESDFDKYSARCKEELDTFKRLSLVDYILLVQDVISWARSQDIPVGIGRGSSGGSLVAYCIGIVGIDPIKYGLFFSRFISEARAKTSVVDGVTYLVGAVPDIDTDFSFERRGEVIKYIETRYPGRTAKIATYGTLSSKICIKEVVKCLLGYSEEEASRISGMVEKKFGAVIDLVDSYAESPDFKKWVDSSKETREAYEIALTLEDIPKSKGQHASGVAIAYGPIYDVSPVERTPDGLDLMTTFDMKDVAYLLVKMDVLGLKNIDIIHNTLKLAGRDIKEIDINDPAIYEFLRENEHYYSFFQIEKGLGKDTVKKLNPSNLEQMSACISVGRPGAMKFIDDLVGYFQNGEITPVFPQMDKILEESGNIIIYQEQINAICQEVYGMSPTDADALRYAVGKKDREKMSLMEPEVRRRGEELGIPNEATDWFWSTCNASADYLFNKCIYEEETVQHKDKGKIKLKEVVVGDHILAYDTANDLDVYVEVEEIYYNNKVCVNSTAGTKTISTSIDHKFLTTNGMKRVVDCIGVREMVKTSSGWHPFVPAHTQLLKIGEDQSKKYPTIDLRVNHPDHNFYCNGIVVSNSHACAYSTITLMDVWLKLYHPREFYLACLNMARNEQDSSHETAIIQKEMRLMNIDLLPPSLRSSEFDFKIEEGGIRYGLSSIKGISDAGMKKLLNFNRANANKIELFNSCLDAKLGLSVVRSLINAGCFDDFKTNRPKLLLEFQLYNELTAKEKKLATQFSQTLGDDTFALVRYLSANNDDKGKIYIKDTRMNTIRRDTLKAKDIYAANSKKSEFYNWYWERELLGYSYSHNLIELFGGGELVTLDSAIAGIKDEYFTVAACVKDIKKNKARQSGKTYYKVFVDDDFADATILSFESTEIFGDHDFYEKWEDNLIIIARVKKTDREYLIAEWIRPLWNEKVL